MSLDTIQGKLSRAEMKNIIAGEDICGYGRFEYAYYCTWSGSGMSGGGYVCAMDGLGAVIATARTIQDEGIPEVNHVNCV